jgi:hypothetical protein
LACGEIQHQFGDSHAFKLPEWSHRVNPLAVEFIKLGALDFAERWLEPWVRDFAT